MFTAFLICYLFLRAPVSTANYNAMSRYTLGMHSYSLSSLVSLEGLR